MSATGVPSLRVEDRFGPPLVAVCTDVMIRLAALHRVLHAALHAGDQGGEVAGERLAGDGDADLHQAGTSSSSHSRPVLVPSGTPMTTVERIRDELHKALQQPEMRSAMASQGVDLDPGTPQELAARIKTETATWAAVIKAAGIRVE